MSSKKIFILMSLIVTGPFEMVTNNTDKNYFDCLKKKNTIQEWGPENDGDIGCA